MHLEKGDPFDSPGQFSTSSGGYGNELYDPLGQGNAVVHTSGIYGVKEGDASLPSGNDVAMMEQLSGWNWGAFWLGWIWLLGMKMEYGLIVLAANFIISPLTGGLLSLAISVYLGVKGNQLAWAYRSFSGIDEYRQVMAAWSKWSWIIVIFSVVAAIGILLLVFGVIMTTGMSS